MRRTSGLRKGVSEQHEDERGPARNRSLRKARLPLAVCENLLSTGDKFPVRRAPACAEYGNRLTRTSFSAAVCKRDQNTVIKPCRGIRGYRSVTHPFRRIAPFATKYCSLCRDRGQSLRRPRDTAVNFLGADGALPVLAYRDARVVLPDIGWSLEPVFLLRRQFHLKEHSAKGDQLRALVVPSSDITAHLEHV